MHRSHLYLTVYCNEYLSFCSIFLSHYGSRCALSAALCSCLSLLLMVLSFLRFAMFVTMAVISSSNCTFLAHIFVIWQLRGDFLEAMKRTP